MVARSVTVSAAAAPSPKNSTNLPTTFCLRSISVMRRTRSVAVTPSLRSPVEVDAYDTDSSTMRILTGRRDIFPSPFSSNAGKE